MWTCLRGRENLCSRLMLSQFWEVGSEPRLNHIRWVLWYCNLTLNSHLLYSANTGGTINLWLSWMSNCVVKLPGIGKGKSGGWGCIWWIFPKKAFIFPAFATKPIVVKYEEIDLTGSKPWQPVGYWKNMSLCREEVVGRVQVYRVINIKQQVQVLKEEEKHRKSAKLPWRHNIRLSSWSLSFDFFS